MHPVALGILLPCVALLLPLAVSNVYQHLGMSQESTSNYLVENYPNNTSVRAEVDSRAHLGFTRSDI